jgi:hypothetical protein
MQFEPLSLSHQPLFERILAPLELGISDYNFVNLWLWRHSRQIEVATHEGFLLVRLIYPNRPPVMLMPVGSGDLCRVLEAIERFCTDRGEPMGFRAVSEAMRADLEAIWPGRFEFAHTPCHDDYLYDTQALIELKGRAYHSKKNFVNRFIGEYGLDFESMQEGQAGEVIAFLQHWFDNAPYASDDEKQGIVDLIGDRTLFSQCSYGILRAQGRVVGFTIGEALSNNVVGIHVEKADGRYRGAYQALNKIHLERFWSHMTVVNREEDLGIEGLRKAKHSYKPIGFVTKYNATLKS